MQFLFTINTNISWLLLKRGSVNKKIRMAEQPHSVEKVHDDVYMLREVFYESLLFFILVAAAAVWCNLSLPYIIRKWCFIKAKLTYLLHFFSFLDQTCQIDCDC